MSRYSTKRRNKREDDFGRYSTKRRNKLQDDNFNILAVDLAIGFAELEKESPSPMIFVSMSAYALHIVAMLVTLDVPDVDSESNSEGIYGSRRLDYYLYEIANTIMMAKMPPFKAQQIQ